MSALLVPTGADPIYTETVSLDGTAFLLRFAFNVRAASWYLDLVTLDGEVVCAGIKLVCNWNLLIKCASALRPQGQLLVITATIDSSTPGLLDLLPQGRCSLVYWPAADVAAGYPVTSS
jgi:uncharacterized protein DUF6983